MENVGANEKPCFKGRACACMAARKTERQQAEDLEAALEDVYFARRRELEALFAA